VEIRELTGAADFADVERLAGRIWRTDGRTVVSGELLRVFAITGSYVAGAFDGHTMLGFAVGVIGLHDGGLELHSHVAGVHPAAQNRGVGFALKTHQRAWAIERAMSTISWTFDPLVRRNAVFNLAKLGAQATDYLVDFYGQMADGVNAGQGSDRWWVEWPLEAEATSSALAGSPSYAEITDLVAGGRVLVDDDGAVRCTPDGDPLACATPPDVEALRSADPDAAIRWRHALRDAVRDALAAGYHVQGVSRDGWYLFA
jgi:predicted GNAT superfamily acetyltransferase